MHGQPTRNDDALTPVSAPKVVRAADAMIEVLVGAGVEVVFGLPGGAIAPLHDALLDHPAVRVVTTRHESGAMFAAAAYARATGKVGVVLVTSGPGVLNCMTGLASAWCDGLPVVLLAGEVPRHRMGKGALQDGSAHHLNIIGMAREVSKLALQVTEGHAAPSQLAHALSTATSGRMGPVAMTLPLDVTSELIKAPRTVSGVEVGSSFASREMKDGLEAAIDALAKAQRPVIYAGSGARWGQGPEQLRALAERLQCPVMTTPKAKGVFPESHPLSLGVFGYGGNPSASGYLEAGTDVLFAVGAGFTEISTDGWSPLLSATEAFIRVDIDPAQLARHYPITLGIAGDAGQVLCRIVEGLPTLRREEARFGVQRFTDSSRSGSGPEGKITPARALWEIQQVMPRTTLYTCDIGEHFLWAAHYLEIDDPNGFVAMTGLSSMGASVGAAIGLKLARPERPVAAICGDGAFAMCLSDVAVAAKERLPVLVAVLNDGRYGMCEVGHKAVYGREVDYSLAPMDVSRVAADLGAASMKVRWSGQIIRDDILELLDDGPLVLDIEIDRGVAMPRNKRNESLSPGRAAVAAGNGQTSPPSIPLRPTSPGFA